MRAEFIDSHNPLWIFERLVIQKREVQNFVWEYYFHKEPIPFSAFTDYLSTVLSHQLGPKVPLGINARKWLDHFVNVEELNAVKKQDVDSLVTLSLADKKEKRAIKNELFRAWVLPKMPFSVIAHPADFGMANFRLA